MWQQVDQHPLKKRGTGGTGTPGKDARPTAAPSLPAGWATSHQTLAKPPKPALRYNPSWMKHTFLRSVVSFLNSHYLWKGLELFWNACLISFHDLPIKKPLSLDSGSNCLRQSKPLQRNVLHGKIHQLRLLVPIQARVIISKCVRFCLPYQPWNIRNQHKNTSIARSHTEALMKSCCKEQIFHWTSPVIHTSLFLPSN